MTRRRRWAWAGAALGVVLVAAIAAWWWRDAWPARAVLVPGDPAGSHPQGFTPDGRTFQASGADGLTSWDVATGRRTGVAPHPVAWRRSFARDGATYVGVLRSRQVPYELARGDVATGAIRARVPLPSMPLFPPTWQAGDRSVRCLLVATGEGLEVATWDLAADHVDVRPLATPIHDVGGARALAPDGRTLACSGSGGSVVELWDVEEDRPVGRLRGLAVPGGATALAFAPDGRTLAVGRGDGAVELRDVPDLRPIRTFSPHSGGFVPDELALAPDGRTLASGGYRHRSSFLIVLGRQFRWAVPSWADRTSFELAVVDLAAGRVLARAPGESSPFFAPDGRRLVSRRRDSTYSVHDAPAPAGQ